MAERRSVRKLDDVRIVFTPWGSFGDLHPYLAIALEVKRRGHDVLVATSEVYREKVEGEGIPFHAVRPDLSEFLDNPERFAALMHWFKGPEEIFRGVIMPSIREMFADVTAAAHCDLLVSHAAMCATPLVAERRRIPWVSVALQPAIMWSVTDPPYMPIFGSFARTSPSIARALFRGVTWSTGRWAQGLYEFRRELGLSPVEKNPLFEGMFSPLGTLALFSPLFAPPQPDWPLNTTTTGFVFYDKLDAASSRLSAEMEDFLAAGSPPVVFTLGTSAVNVPGDFYKASASAVEKLGCRAILLTGRDMKGVEELSSSKVLCAGYAPYSLLLPRSAATVHSGGVGTTGQALRSGKPQIVMPFSHDQPDNGARVERMGVGAMIKRRRYRTAIVTETLERLLSDQRVTARACEVGAAIGAENGIQSAADALERFASTA